MRALALSVVLVLAAAGVAQEGSHYSGSDCASCHGNQAEGGFGPALAGTKLPYELFLKIVREGTADMPPYSAEEFSDDEAQAVFDELAAMPAATQEEIPIPEGGTANPYSETSCAGCHGSDGMGGLGPPVTGTKLPFEQFLKIVREGTGMMPGTPADELTDDALREMHQFLQSGTRDESQVPMAARIGRLLTTSNVAWFFLGVTLFALVFGIRVLVHYLKLAGWAHLAPHVRRFGTGRATAVFLKAMLVEGLLVASLWRRDRFRWTMHALMLYGFLGLMLADILIQITNPQRGEMSMGNPIKMLAVLSGVSVLAGVIYVHVRYKRDPFIDNGLTWKQDFLFAQLLLHTIFSGFLTVGMNDMPGSSWVMPVYIYHLAAVGLLLGTAPFTRFRHAWVVPALIGMTHVTEAITESKVHPGFEREPSPGRHHKSQRIAEDVLRQVDPSFEGNVTLRYYP